ncbi:hypothetical protein DW106_08185 [Ruminococcus sp. AM09-18-1]|nr:hypothetical protein DW106_08185 [Ruminococcus sp. AM09-18-1]DAO17828.1 MAG TPA: hypothetical protein [Caudoviricetes sp.]
MIKLENVVLASPEQMVFIIEGMRNPMNSWDKSDSYAGYEYMGAGNNYFKLGENDHSLMQRLAKAGTDHRKFMRMMPVYVRITAPLYWWKEYDTYKVSTVANSCSTMHKIAEKEFTLGDFSTDNIIDVGEPEYEDMCDDIVLNLHFDFDNQYYDPHDIFGEILLPALNLYREKYLKTKDKKYWWQMIQLLPSSYNQTRNVMLNYEVLANIYHSRKNHKLDEWREFCSWIETLPYSELITGEENNV